VVHVKEEEGEDEFEDEEEEVPDSVRLVKRRRSGLMVQDDDDDRSASGSEAEEDARGRDEESGDELMMVRFSVPIHGVIRLRELLESSAGDLWWCPSRPAHPTTNTSTQASGSCTSASGDHAHETSASVGYGTRKSGGEEEVTLTPTNLSYLCVDSVDNSMNLPESTTVLTIVLYFLYLLLVE
jgi:hypothetical protein